MYTLIKLVSGFQFLVLPPHEYVVVQAETSHQLKSGNLPKTPAPTKITFNFTSKSVGYYMGDTFQLCLKSLISNTHSKWFPSHCSLSAFFWLLSSITCGWLIALTHIWPEAPVRKPLCAPKGPREKHCENWPMLAVDILFTCSCSTTSSSW